MNQTSEDYGPIPDTTNIASLAAPLDDVLRRLAELEKPQHWRSGDTHQFNGQGTPPVFWCHSGCPRCKVDGTDPGEPKPVR